MNNEELFEEITRLLHRILERYNYLLDIYIRTTRSQKEQVEYLIESSKGIASQRTEEWYKMRNACITASAMNSVLGPSDAKRNKFIVEKCGKPAFFSNKFTEWGIQYEPVAVQVYEKIFNVKIHEAPLLIHPIYPYVGASCDGLVIDQAKQDGYLIEIKCPHSRVPNGEIPEHYWEQPQIQMEVCKTETCVFFDCKFEEYHNKEEFLADPSENYFERGFMIEYYQNSEKKYLYDNPLTSKQDPIQAEKEFREKYTTHYKPHADPNIFRFIRWKLVLYSVIPQKRNTGWFKDNIPRLKHIWDVITHFRKVGIDNFDTKSKLFLSKE